MLYASGHEPTKGSGEQGTGAAQPAARGDVLHHGRPHPARTLGMQDSGRHDAAVVRQPHGEYQGGRCAHLQRPALGAFQLGRGMRRAWASSRRPAALWPIGSSSTTARSRTIRPSCPPPGTRDPAMRPAPKGPYEAALKGHSLQDPKQPLEILRTIHSFDPASPAPSMSSIRTARS